MSKPSPYCECHKWDQPGGICAYCIGYTDGWTTEATAVRRERDALLTRVEKLREALSLMVDVESPCGPLAHTIAVFALGTDDTAAGKGVG